MAQGREAGRQTAGFVPSVLGLFGGSAPVAFGVVDADLRIVEANETFARLVERRANRLGGQCFPALLSGVRSEEVERLVQAVLLDDQVVTGHRLRTAPAEETGVVWSLTAFRLDHDPPYVGVLVDDITDRLLFEEEAGRAAGAAALVLEAGLSVGTTLDLATTLKEVTGLLVPSFGDTVQVDFAESFSPDPITGGNAEAPIARHVLSTGRSVVASPQPPEGGRQPEFHSVACVPLSSAGRAFATLSAFVGGSRPAYGPHDLALLEDVGVRVATALAHARAFGAERRTAVELQNSLLPSIPELPTVKVASRYLPASRTETVGGDWFDVIPGPAGRVAFVIGDVIGHGVAAAAVMGQLRTAVLTLAASDPPPGEVLVQLERVVREFDLVAFATCLYAVYDPVTRQLDVASAGHLPPMLIDRGGAVRSLDDLVVEPPLGVAGGTFPAYTVEDVDGATLVMFTDGLVERHDVDLDARLAMLGRSVGAPAESLEARCDGVLADMVPPEGGVDDVALMMAELRGVPEEDLVEWAFAPEAVSAGEARERVARQADAWRLADEKDTLVLLVSELATNVVRHGRGPMTIRLLRLSGQLTCEVEDRDYRVPPTRPVRPSEGGGWGLNLVQSFARRWGARSTGTGKVVWFQLDIAPKDVREGERHE